MSEAERIPLVEESVNIEKHTNATGKVRVTTQTALVEEMALAELEQSEVQVTRVPIDQEVDVAPGVRTEGNVTIIPVLEEILVVEKRLVLREEVHVRRLNTSERFEVPVSLRKQRAVVERLDPDTDKLNEE